VLVHLVTRTTGYATREPTLLPPGAHASTRAPVVAEEHVLEDALEVFVEPLPCGVLDHVLA
jgi:hypothetical protein